MLGRVRSRGISTFIATLLLMVLAVAAGAIIYAYTMGYLGGLGSTKTPGTLSLDSATADASTDDITAYVRNIGKGSVTIDVAYVDGNKIDLTDVTISEGSVQQITIDCSGTVDLQAGKTYEVKLVATDGTNLVFTVKAS